MGFKKRRKFFPGPILIIKLFVHSCLCSWAVGISKKIWIQTYFKGGPEPLEKEIRKILGSKREDRFSDPFLKLVQIFQVRFFVPASLL